MIWLRRSAGPARLYPVEAAAEQAPRLTAELIEDLCRELDMDPWAFFDNSNRVLRGRISTHFLCLGYERITDILRECIKDARHAGLVTDTGDA